MGVLVHVKTGTPGTSLNSWRLLITNPGPDVAKPSLTWLSHSGGALRICGDKFRHPADLCHHEDIICDQLIEPQIEFTNLEFSQLPMKVRDPVVPSIEEPGVCGF